MKLERTPLHIRKAKLEGNTELLSKAGKKGAEHAAIKAALEAEKKEREFMEHAKHYHVNLEGDVLPPETEE